MENDKPTENAAQPKRLSREDLLTLRLHQSEANESRAIVAHNRLALEKETATLQARDQALARCQADVRERYTLAEGHSIDAETGIVTEPGRAN